MSMSPDDGPGQRHRPGVATPAGPATADSSDARRRPGDRWSPVSPASATRPPAARLGLALLTHVGTAAVVAGIVTLVVAVVHASTAPVGSGPLPDGYSYPLVVVVTSVGLVAYSWLLAPISGASRCWFRLRRSVRLLRPGARARWRATYGRQRHLNGWDLWGAPYVLHGDDDVARERADRTRQVQRWRRGRVWVGAGRQRTSVADLPSWLHSLPELRRVELRTSRWSALGFLLPTLAFVVLGVLAVRFGETWLGWAGISFFGVCAVAAVGLLLRGNRLVLTPAGMRITGLRRAAEYPWEDCQGFRPMTVARRGERVVTRSVVFGTGPARGGGGSGIPWPGEMLTDTYGHGVDELCEFLELYRARSLAPGHGLPPGGASGA